MRKIVDILILIVSFVGTIFGVLSLLTIIGVADILPFYKNFGHILIGYVIVVVSMATGIMSFNLFAGRRENPLKTILSIGVTSYSTILTLPLVATFVLCLVQKLGVTFTGFLEGFIAPIYDDLVSIFKPEWAQYLVFVGGTLMGIIFIAVPIIMCIKTVKPKDVIAVERKRRR